MDILKKIGEFVLDTIQAIVLALSLFIVCYLFLFAPHQVKGLSMFPSFNDKEFLLTNKLTYRFAEPKRGDVIVFKAPVGESCAEIECEYIKRVIALPGERVMVAGGKVFLNGQALDESAYLAADVATRPGAYLAESVEKTIPEGNFLALGDNRPHSRDGREFGPIAKSAIVGKFWIRYWPVTKFGFFKSPVYKGL